MDSTDSADSIRTAYSTHSLDSADSVDSTDSLDYLYLSFIYSATKGLHLLFSYPLSYTWLKGEPQISMKERLIPSYLQYGVLGDCVF